MLHKIKCLSFLQNMKKNYFVIFMQLCISFQINESSSDFLYSVNYYGVLLMQMLIKISIIQGFEIATSSFFLILKIKNGGYKTPRSQSTTIEKIHVFYETGHLGLNHIILIHSNITEMLVCWSRKKIDYPPFPRAAIISDIAQHKDIQGASVPRHSFHLYTLWSWALQAKVRLSIWTSELNMGRGWQDIMQILLDKKK